MYVLNQNIKIGDIILVDSNSKIASGIKLQAILATCIKALAKILRGIKTPVNGSYSHVAIVISESQAIEALGGSGVQISSLLRFHVDDVSNLAVYRAKDIEEKKFSQLLDRAIKHQAKSYDLTGTIKSVLPLSTTKESKFFCSELVTHLYNEMGIKLFDKNSARVKPNDFTRCNKLTNVSSETISIIPPYIQKRYEKRPHLWKPLDNKHSSASPDALRHQKFLKDAQKVFKKRKLDIPKNMHDIVEIITRPSEDGNVYLDADLSNDLMELHDKHRIFEELEAEINKAIENDLDDYLKKIDEEGVEIARQELAFCEDYLTRFREKIERKTEETFWIGKVAEKFPLNIIKARATYSFMALDGQKQVLEKQIQPTIDALKRYIENA